jgi:hypothetical protein
MSINYSMAQRQSYLASKKAEAKLRERLYLIEDRVMAMKRDGRLPS